MGDKPVHFSLKMCRLVFTPQAKDSGRGYSAKVSVDPSALEYVRAKEANLPEDARKYTAMYEGVDAPQLAQEQLSKLKTMNESISQRAFESKWFGPKKLTMKQFATKYAGILRTSDNVDRNGDPYPPTLPVVFETVKHGVLKDLHEKGDKKSMDRARNMQADQTQFHALLWSPKENKYRTMRVDVGLLNKNSLKIERMDFVLGKVFINAQKIYVSLKATKVYFFPEFQAVYSERDNRLADVPFVEPMQLSDLSDSEDEDAEREALSENTAHNNEANYGADENSVALPTDDSSF